jgi:6-phosphogluconolactonase
VSHPLIACVGSRTTRERRARGEGISVFAVDAASGALQLIQVWGDLVNPSYLALSKPRHGSRFLYCVHGDRSEVSAFAMERRSGTLRFINRRSTEGHNPVHLALDASGRFLIVTNHLGASVVVLTIEQDGSLGPLVQQVALSGPLGPHRVEQTQAKPHFSLFDPSGRWLLVPDKGLDRVFSFAFEQGRLRPAALAFAATREGAGPRHAAFHPALAVVYGINELDSSLTSYRFDTVTGELSPWHVLPTLPALYTGNSRAAGIQVDASGRHLYASNRGHDSVAIFSLASQTGQPLFLGTVPSAGRTPRSFALSPGGRHLYALNEDSHNIIAFDVDASTGMLSGPRQAAACGSPVCMVFAQDNDSVL